MLASAIAVGTALIFSLRHQAALHIKSKECCRYWLKSINLALCYRGFAPNRDFESARNAGRAAFYCCAYDVVTDWRHYDETAFDYFRKLLNQEVAKDLAVIAFKLYEEERNGALQLDGLSRGIDALEFVTRLIGSEKYIRRNLNFRHLAIVMQIVDDVLDLEDDQRNGEINCLLISPSQRTKHLRALLAFDMQGFEKVFPHATVLCRVIRSAKRKAELMIPAQRLFVEKSPSIHDSPNQYLITKSKLKERATSAIEPKCTSQKQVHIASQEFGARASR
jgi:hypothetical protein